MAVQSNPTNGMPSLVLIDQQSGRTPPNATAIKRYFSDFVKYFNIESSMVDVDVEIVDGKFTEIKFYLKICCFVTCDWMNIENLCREFP